MWLGGGFKDVLFSPRSLGRWSNLTFAQVSDGLVQPSSSKHSMWKGLRFRYDLWRLYWFNSTSMSIFYCSLAGGLFFSQFYPNYVFLLEETVKFDWLIHISQMSCNHDLVDEAAFFPPGYFCPKGTFKSHPKKGRHLILVEDVFRARRWKSRWPFDPQSLKVTSNL